MEPTPPSGPARGRDPSEWKRAAALFALLLAFSTISPMVLVGLPFVLLVLVLPIRRLGALGLAAVVLILTIGGSPPSGLWYAERGWALLVGGWFVAVTLRWPDTRFATRALGSALGALATAVLFFSARPMAWAVLDWRFGERIRAGVGTALVAIETLQGEGGVSSALREAVYTTAETQSVLLPALVGLSSMAALGVGWWLYVRVAQGRQGALGPLKDFRFNDHLVWLFVAGLLALIVGTEDLWTRAGSNAVLFMGALYALRGAAVVLFINGGISALGVVAVTLGMIFLAPALLLGALVIGLGDTWLDLRTRAARSSDTSR